MYYFLKIYFAAPEPGHVPNILVRKQAEGYGLHQIFFYFQGEFLHLLTLIHLFTHYIHLNYQS
ncbi:MAG: hypothetical protein DRG58_03175 [Deltaproteobacteria bacterium]|nr:MAG: hypothetical protein DRG58_03175 [Deltaproteobacteria bacterium]